MSTSVSFHVVFDHIPDFGTEMESRVGSAIRNATYATEELAVRNAPVKTGFLRNSIGSQAVGLSGAVYATAEYARYQENDPYNRHFMANALEAVAPLIVGFIEQG